jgi:hypothetical protein
MKNAPRLGSPLMLVRKVLPLATPAAAKGWAFGLLTKGRWLNDLDELSRGIPLFSFKNPDFDAVAWSGERNKNHPSLRIASNAGTGARKIGNVDNEGLYGLRHWEGYLKPEQKSQD